jgi:hypothetical protein
MKKNSIEEAAKDVLLSEAPNKADEKKLNKELSSLKKSWDKIWDIYQKTDDDDLKFDIKLEIGNIAEEMEAITSQM